MTLIKHNNNDNDNNDCEQNIESSSSSSNSVLQLEEQFARIKRIVYEAKEFPIAFSVEARYKDSCCDLLVRRGYGVKSFAHGSSFVVALQVAKNACEENSIPTLRETMERMTERAKDSLAVDMERMHACISRATSFPVVLVLSDESNKESLCFSLAEQGRKCLVLCDNEKRCILMIEDKDKTKIHLHIILQGLGESVGKFDHDVLLQDLVKSTIKKVGGRPMLFFGKQLLNDAKTWEECGINVLGSHIDIKALKMDLLYQVYVEISIIPDVFTGDVYRRSMKLMIVGHMTVAQFRVRIQRWVDTDLLAYKLIHDGKKVECDEQLMWDFGTKAPRFFITN